jgi:CysZ protein
MGPEDEHEAGIVYDFVAGGSYPLQALMLLMRRPRLWSYVLIPILVNLAVGVTLYLGLLLAGLSMINRLVSELPTWAAGLGVLLEVFLVICILIVTAFVLVRIAVVLGAPWYAQLANHVAEIRTGQRRPDAKAGLGDSARALATAFVFELQKLLFVGTIGVGLLLLNIIPGMGTLLAGAGGLALGVILTCLDFLEAPLAPHRAFRQKLTLVRRTMPGSAGFGLVCLGLVSIPFLNLLAIPVCMVAGTLFVCDRMRLER